MVDPKSIVDTSEMFSSVCKLRPDPSRSSSTPGKPAVIVLKSKSYSLSPVTSSVMSFSSTPSSSIRPIVSNMELPYGTKGALSSCIIALKPSGSRPRPAKGLSAGSLTLALAAPASPLGIIFSNIPPVEAAGALFGNS